MTERHALVIGGSLGGLMIARLLVAQGWTATIFERSRGNLASRGAGLGSQPPLFDVLSRLQLRFDDSIALKIHSRACLGPDGETICEIQLREVSTAWDLVYRLLRNGMPEGMYRGGMALVRFESVGDRIEAIFEDQSRATGDLLIGADGVYSAVRRQLIDAAESSYAGYVSWRGLIAQQDIPGEFRDCLLSRMNFCFPDGEMALSIPVPNGTGDADPGLRCQFSWFRPVPHSMLMEEFCVTEGTGPLVRSTSPHSIQPALVEQLKTRARQVLPKQIATLVERAEHPLVQPIYDFETSCMCSNRVVLLGDAAFVARPHVGTGVTKAALDAAALADALGEADLDIPNALKRYERERVPAGRQLVSRGKALGAYLSAQLLAPDRRDASGLYRNPEQYMREFGGGGE